VLGEPEVIAEGQYDPFGGLGHTMTAQAKLVKLAEGAEPVVDLLLDDITHTAVVEASKNALYVFVDSFGLNHTLESTNIGAGWVQRIWDRGIDTYNYSGDIIEPLPCPFESCTGLAKKELEDFDIDNFVNADATLKPMAKTNKAFEKRKKEKREAASRLTASTPHSGG